MISIRSLPTGSLSIHSLSAQKKRSLENFAKLGFFTKGIVYILIGILATMTAFGLGGSINGKTGIFQIILEQPLGRILLAMVAIGLLGYTAWRWTQAFIDPENIGQSDAKNKLQRLGYFISGFSYGTAASFALKMTIQGVNSASQGGRSNVIAQTLSIPAGDVIIGILALAIIGKGIYDIWKGISSNHMDKITNLSFKLKEAVQKAGQVGYISRGIVLLIAGYLTGRAALEFNPTIAKGTEGAFEFMFSTTNAWLVGIIAFGLALYGLFMVIKSKEFYIR